MTIFARYFNFQDFITIKPIYTTEYVTQREGQLLQIRLGFFFEKLKLICSSAKEMLSNFMNQYSDCTNVRTSRGLHPDCPSGNMTTNSY